MCTGQGDEHHCMSLLLAAMAKGLGGTTRPACSGAPQPFPVAPSPVNSDIMRRKDLTEPITSILCSEATLARTSPLPPSFPLDSQPGPGHPGLLLHPPRLCPAGSAWTWRPGTTQVSAAICGTKRGSRSRGEHSDMREVEGHPSTHSHAHTSSSPPAPLPPQPLQRAPHRSHHRLVLGSVLQSRRGPSVVWQEREVSGTPCCSWAASSMTASHAPSEPV